MNEVVQDAELLRRYAENRSEAAFAEIVRRRLDLVFSAALRRLGGDRHRAADVSQQVFVTLARHAPALTRHTVLTGWLYTTTRNAALDALRTERRRSTREHEAHVLHELAAPSAPPVEWDRLRPLIDETVDELGDRDREAVLLRFFDNRAFAEIGVVLGVSEDAARMRVERALDRLRGLLERRGVTSTATALGTLLAGQSVGAAPAGLAATIAGTAMVGSGAIGGLATGLKLFAFMNTSNLPAAVAVVAALVALGAVVHETRVERASTDALASASQENQVAADRLRALQRRAETMAQQAADLQQALEQAQTSVVAAPFAPAVVAPTPAMAGEAFLAAHPEAQKLIEAAGEGFFAETNGAALQSLGLARSEYDEIVAAAAREMSWKLGVGDLEFPVNQNGPEGVGADTRRLRELLGDARFRQFEEVQRTQAARSLAGAVAAATYESETPLTREQAEAMVQSVSAHSLSVADRPVAVSLASTDWPEVTRDLANVLSASQLAVFDAARVNVTPFSRPAAGAAGKTGAQDAVRPRRP